MAYARIIRRRSERGAIFVITLAILTTLVAIVASVAISENVALQQEDNRVQHAKALAAAKAGIQQAIETISDEGTNGSTTSTTSTSVTGASVDLPSASQLTDDWATIGTTGNDRFIVGDCSFRLQIVDACSKINLNTVTATQLQNMPLDQEHMDALTDWRSTGQNALPDGAKDAYYNGLQNPYQTAVEPFATVDELLDVRYFTPADVFDPPTDETSNPLPDFADGRTPVLYELFTADSIGGAYNTQGTALPALSSATLATLTRAGLGTAAQTIFTARASATWAALLRTVRLTGAQLTALLTNFTIGSETGRININTAPAAVLQTIPNLTSDIAQSIVNQQQTGFPNMGSLLTVSGLTTATSVQNFLDYFTVKSQTFLVRVVGTCGTAQVPLQATLSVTTAATGSTVTIQSMDEQPFNDMTGRWGWQATTNNDIQLLGNS
jgi:type II secretory pathway component PulK